MRLLRGSPLVLKALSFLGGEEGVATRYDAAAGDPNPNPNPHPN